MTNKNKDKTVWIYGVHSVAAVLKSRPDEVSAMMIAEGVRGSRDQHIAQAENSGIKIRRVPPADLTECCGSDAHQGIAVLTMLPEYVFLEDVLAKEPSVLVALDGITDPQNLGAIARSAEALGAGALVIPRDRSAGITPAAHKVSEGALEWLPVCRETNLARSLEASKNKGYWVYAADQDAETDLGKTDWENKTVIVIGSEGKGIRPGVLKRADFRLSIRTPGKTESLNAAHAAAIMIWHALSKTGTG
ncbi:MAG: 23S rRNA (guanosine(2251)-2'-O)-methyltransferase RlmB [bacterium]